MRIVWNQEEKRALHDCMVDICYDKPSITAKSLLQLAQQEVIPYDRRTVINDQRVFNYKALVASARAKAYKHSVTVKTPQHTVAAPKPEAEPVRKIDTIGEVFELFIDAIADRVVSRLKIEARVEEPKPEAAPPPPFLGNGWLDELEKLAIRSKAARAKRPTALIVGLNGAQMECIKQSRPEVDFTFVTAEQAVSHHTFNKDHTFLMTKFINHPVQSKYRKHPNLHYVNGGVSDLKTLLHGIFKKETA